MKYNFRTFDYSVNNINLWNEEETEKTNYIYINFPLERFRVWFNNKTKQIESIENYPFVLGRKSKEYKPSTKVPIAMAAKEEAEKIYFQTV